jgi:hypothetical protein
MFKSLAAAFIALATFTPVWACDAPAANRGDPAAEHRTGRKPVPERPAGRACRRHGEGLT